MMRSIRSRLLAGMLCGVAVLLGLFGLGVYETIRRALVEEFDAALAVTARSVAGAAEMDHGRFDIELERGQHPEFERKDRPAYFQFSLAEGGVLSRSASLGKDDLPRFGGSLEAPAFRELTLPDGRPGRAAGVRFRPKDEDADKPRKGRDLATRPKPPEVVLVVAKDTVALAARLRLLRWLLLSAGAAVLVVAVLIALVVVRRGLRPLGSLAARIAAIKPGGLDQSVPTATMPSEIAPVAAKLNDLLSRLDAAFRRERSFTANVAHELRTPLAGVRSTIEVALSRDRSGAEYREALADCLDIALRMQAMTGNLLTLARLDAGQVTFHAEAIDLRELAESCWQGFRHRAQARGLAFDNAVPAGLSCTSSRESLSMALANLLDNAVEYADQGGRIQVTGRTVDGAGECADEGGRVHATGRAAYAACQVAGAAVELAVANTGCKLSPEQASHAGERFWRGDAARTNTGVHCGLGLALVRRIAAALGGTASITVDESGVFTVRLVLPGQG